MVKSNQSPFTEDQLAKNPSVDPKVVNEAYRIRKELEDLGVWEESGIRVRNPFEIKPDPIPHGQKMEQIISQNR